MREKGPFQGHSRAWLWLPPVVAFIAVNLVLWLAAHLDGFNYFATESWIRWDSFHYLEVAERGVTYEPCTIPSLFPLGSLIDSVKDFLGFNVVPTDACGNAGWFPGYGLLIRALGVIGVTPGAAGVSIALGAQVGTLMVLWTWFLRDRPNPGSLFALVAAAFFFGHVYYRAVFPLSLVTLLILVHLRLVLNKRWLAAGVAGAVASFAYPTAYLIAGATALWLLLVPQGKSLRRRLLPMAQASGVTMVGFGAVVLYQWIETGVWGAFFNVQSQFGYALSLPVERLTRAARPLFDDGVTLLTVPSLQTVLVAVLMTTAIAASLARWKSLTESERWVVLFLIPAWLFPLMLGGRSSLYRIESVLLPVVILIPRAPKVAQIAIVGALVAMSYPMALLFFRNTLI